MIDRFTNTQPSLSGPASAGFAAIPSDGADLPEVTRALFVGSTGNLSLTLMSGSTLMFQNVQAGSLLPLRVVRVRASGTTAGNIIGLV